MIQFSHLEGHLELGFFRPPKAVADCSQHCFLFSPIFSPLKELFIFVFLKVDNKTVDVLSRKKPVGLVCVVYGPNIPRDSCQSCQPSPLPHPTPPSLSPSFTLDSQPLW